MTEFLRINNFVISDVPIVVRFLFLEQKLHNVVLRVEPIPNEVTFTQHIETLSALLRAKYGTPLEDIDKNLSAGTRNIKRSWKSNDVRIALYGIYDESLLTMISIVYDPHPKEELDKL